MTKVLVGAADRREKVKQATRTFKAMVQFQSTSNVGAWKGAPARAMGPFLDAEITQLCDALRISDVLAAQGGRLCENQALSWSPGVQIFLDPRRGNVVEIKTASKRTLDI